VSETVDWDEPVSDEIATEWNIWKNTLKDIETLRIPRICSTCRNNTSRSFPHSRLFTGFVLLLHDLQNIKLKIE
jgi:hypothetical protein